jgi:hypothetical protein
LNNSAVFVGKIQQISNITKLGKRKRKKKKEKTFEHYGGG